MPSYYQRDYLSYSPPPPAIFTEQQEDDGEVVALSEVDKLHYMVKSYLSVSSFGV